MSLFTIIFLLTMSWVNAGPAVLSNHSVSGLQDNQASQSPLTLAQVEKLIRVPTDHKRNAIAKDRAIARDISRRGVGFEVSASVINSLRVLGAGPATIRALERVAKWSNGNALDSPERTKILVADFEGPALPGYSAAEIILDELSDAARDYADIEIIALEETIRPKQGRSWALKRAKDLNASIIIWGWYTKNEHEVLLNVHFQLVDDTASVILLSEKQSTILPISDLFKFQIRLGKQMGYLSFFTLGAARLVAGDIAGARNLLTAAIRQSNAPEDMANPASAYFLRAAVSLMEATTRGWSLPMEPFEDLARAIQLDSNNSAAYSLRCSAHTMRGDFAQALEDCEKAIELSPTESGAYSAKGLLLFQQGDAKRGVDALEKAIHISEAAGEIERPLMYRGLLFVHNGDADGAIATFTKLIELKPPPFLQAYCYLLRGYGYQVKKQFDLAIKDYKDVLRIAPYSSLAYSLLGDVYYQIEQYPAAVTSYEKAIQLGFNQPQAYMDLADAYVKNGKDELAKENYSKAISLKPDFAAAYFGRARIFKDEGNFQKAVEDYDVVLKLEPQNGIAFLMRGISHFRQKQFEEAFADYGEALKLLSDKNPTYYFRGLAYAKMGELDLAIRDYDSALAINPNDSESYFQRALVRHRKSQYEIAIKDFTEAIRITPNYPEAYLSRSISLAKNGDIRGAISDLNKVLELSSDPAQRKEAERLLALLNAR